MSNLIKSFDHIAMTVKEFDKTIDWYVNNLGFSVKTKTENRERGTRMAFLEGGGFAMLEIFGFIDSNRPVQGPTLRAEETGIKHISFYVDDMNGMCERLKNVSVEFTAFTPQRVVFRDPNGILIELRIAPL
ncbi:MAG: methylmalonyl-CoA/ethylmalonyl-CoA epimerase [Thermoproteota archaeon]|nr:methylmalonyl-CoA/ethylmalonyl-CoA epimerase [Thermoproteota archaeon]